MAEKILDWREIDGWIKHSWLRGLDIEEQVKGGRVDIVAQAVSRILHLTWLG